MVEEAGKSKPVVIFIYGSGLNTPTYADVLELKKASEAKGQPFLLIPPPNDKGEPSIDLNSETYNLSYIQSQLDANFGKGGAYAGRDYVPMIYTHGNPQFHGFGHNHTLGAGPPTESNKLYLALLSVDGNCLGVNDGACFSGAGMVGFNEAMRQTAAKHKQPVEFNASASFNNTAVQSDCNSMINELKARLADGDTITPNAIRSAYLKELRFDVPIVSKTFDPKNLDPQWRVQYDDLDTKYEKFYEEFHKAPSGMPPESSFAALTDAHVLTHEKYESIKEALKKDTLQQFSGALSEAGLYGEALALADAHYDMKGNNKTIDAFQFVSQNSSDMFDDNMWRVRLIPDHAQQIAAYEIAAKDTPSACFAKKDTWQSGLSEAERTHILTIAVHSAAEKHQSHFFSSAALWEKMIPAEEKLELFKKATEAAPKLCLSDNYEWKDALPAEQRDKLLAKAAHLLAQQEPDACLSMANKWASVMPADEKEKLLIEAASATAEKKPYYSFEYLDTWQDGVPAADKKRILLTAARELAKDSPGVCFTEQDRWGALASPEEKKEILLTALKNARENDPESIFKFEEAWQPLVTADDKKLLLEEAAVKASVRAPYDCLAFTHVWQDAPEPIATMFILARAADNAATAEPQACLEHIKKWQDSVSAKEKKDIVTKAVKKLAESDFRAEHIFTHFDKWKDVVEPKEVFAVLKEASHNDPRNCFDKASTWKDSVTPAQQLEILKDAAQSRPSSCFLYTQKWANLVTDEQKKEVLAAAAQAAAQKDPAVFMDNMDTWSAAVTPTQKNALTAAMARRAASVFPKYCFDNASQWQDAVTPAEKNAILSSAARTEAAYYPQEFFSHAQLWLDAVKGEDRLELITQAAAKNPIAARKFLEDQKEVLTDKEKQGLVELAPPEPKPSEKNAPAKPAASTDASKKQAAMGDIPADLKTAVAQYRDTQYVPKAESDRKTPGNLPQIAASSDASRLV